MLSNTGVQVSSVQFTRAGNIALTPHAPCTPNELLQYANMFQHRIAHDRPTSSLTFELDSTWHSVVVPNVPVTNFDRIERIDPPNAIQAELLRWNPKLCSNFKNIRLLCREDEIFEHEKVTVVASFSNRESVDTAIQDGINLYGELLWPQPFKPRRHSPHSDSSLSPSAPSSSPSDTLNVI